MALLSPLACGNLIGLGEYAADPDGSSDDNAGDNGSGGSASSGGSSGSGGSAGKCVNDVAGTDVDTGCTVTQPMCDTETSSCVDCISDEDCQDDKSCNFDTCDEGVCKFVDDGLGTVVTLMDTGMLNGSFEDDAFVEVSEDPGFADWYEAVGWGETGGFFPCTGTLTCHSYADESSCLADVDCEWNAQDYGPSQLTFDCSGGSCSTTGGLPGASDGSRVAWLGGVDDWQDRLVSPTFVIPATATTLRFLADANIQTTETTSLSKYDTFEWQLVDADGNVMASITEGSNLNGQKVPEPDDGGHNVWTNDFIDETISVQAGWGGRVVTLQMASETDTVSYTDFVFDNIRVTATRVCD